MSSPPTLITSVHPHWYVHLLNLGLHGSVRPSLRGDQPFRRREETGTEAFWWCNWQQMWGKTEIKEKEFKIISVWACMRELSWAQWDRVLTFVSLIQCCPSAFILQWSELWKSDISVQKQQWKDTERALNENITILHWSARTEGLEEIKCIY